jgi:glycosyltransferase involved in cell wall biosynthesis
MIETAQRPQHRAPIFKSTHSFLDGLRLLIVADSSTTHTHRWAHWFRDRGSQVTVLSPFSDGIDGVRVEQFPRQRHWYHSVPKARMLVDYLPFRRLIAALDPQLIHFHFVSEGGRAWYWDGLLTPVVSSTWGQDAIFDLGPRPKAQASLRKMLGRSRFVTATTHQLARETMPYVAPGQPIYVIPFGVDLDRFSPRLHEPSDTVVLGFVKHLLPKYGPDVALEAFAMIHAQRPATRLLMAGRGPMREALQARIATLRLTHAVTLLGRVPHEQVPQLVQSFDLMLMPSIYESETFGVAAIEASACAVPVVASRIGGVPEAVLHNQTGLLVPPRDPRALAQACLDLIDNPARRRALGVAGRRFVEEHYVWQENARSMEEIYRAALTGADPVGVPRYQPGVMPALAA